MVKNNYLISVFSYRLTDPTKKPADISYQSELKRKVLHLLALIIPFCIYYLDKEKSLWILIPLSTLALILEVARVRSKAISDLIYKLVGPLMRDEEKTALGSPVVINGASWVMLSATLLTIIFPVYIVCASLSMFILGDAAAALIGRKFGKMHWPGSPKTIEGSIAFFLVAGVTLIWFNVLPWYVALIVSCTAMLLEVIPLPFNDNVRVPLLTGLFIYGIEYVFGNTQPSLFF